MSFEEQSLNHRPADLSAVVADAMLARRVVMVRGVLDESLASDVAATVMTLDATGDDDVELRLQAVSGPLEPALTLLDVLSVVGIGVNTVGLGLLSGGPVAVLAAGTTRRVARHARLYLREPDDSLSGRATEIERAVAQRSAVRDAFLRQVADHTGRSQGEIEVEWSEGPYLDAEDAVTRGYADLVD